MQAGFQTTSSQYYFDVMDESRLAFISATCHFCLVSLGKLIYFHLCQHLNKTNYYLLFLKIWFGILVYKRFYIFSVKITILFRRL